MISPLVVIAGPTASGKSAFAMEIAKKYNGELICADSRTVYKGMDIGTAKPSVQDQQEVTHHVLDIVRPNRPFTAAEFKNAAQAAIADITSRGKLPIMVGGTGLYIDAVIFDYTFGAAADPKRRAELQGLEVPELQMLCMDNGIHLPLNVKNKRHLVRAIELGGLVNQPRKLRPDTLVVAITTNREELKSRITARAHHMLQDGVLKEVAQLGKKYGWNDVALTGNIYRTLRPVVAGQLSVEEGLQNFITSDMQLAKRQVTWLKRNPYVIWGSPEQLAMAIEHFVQQIMVAESIPEA